MTETGRILREAAEAVDRGSYEASERLIREALTHLLRFTTGRDPVISYGLGGGPYTQPISL